MIVLFLQLVTKVPKLLLLIISFYALETLKITIQENTYTFSYLYLCMYYPFKTSALEKIIKIICL